MSPNQSAATPYNTQAASLPELWTMAETSASSLPELWTMAEVAKTMRRTRSGVDKLRARDPSFPKPLKDGDNRRSRIYFVRQEVEAYLCARLQAREVV